MVEDAPVAIVPGMPRSMLGAAGVDLPGALRPPALVQRYGPPLRAAPRARR